MLKTAPSPATSTPLSSATSLADPLAELETIHRRTTWALFQKIATLEELVTDLESIIKEKVIHENR